jgi:hypothetical protein
VGTKVGNAIEAKLDQIKNIFRYFDEELIFLNTFTFQGRSVFEFMDRVLKKGIVNLENNGK